ncbi:unnamed protein product [Parnassius apollo]|uniref:(apollo) hypothetical protein n=1 Tax=Parnassius apollo TaxID=110799 RepID=A0A8S3W674_PARAO|nr:unnamed protein product [Parnassius apollo]
MPDKVQGQGAIGQTKSTSPALVGVQRFRATTLETTCALVIRTANLDVCVRSLTTQMGIPVPTKRIAKPPAPKYVAAAKTPRSHAKRDDALDMDDSALPPNNHVEDFKRASEVSRMGNYFNIVIAPPPIKALQPRKLLHNDNFRPPAKQIN